MKNSAQDNFFQPIVSTLGIFVSLLSAISPIFSFGPITSFFIIQELAPLSGFIAFIFGLIFIWLIFEHYRFINFNVGRLKDRGKGYKEPFLRIMKSQFLLFLSLINVILAFCFIYIKIKIIYPGDIAIETLGFTQALIYVVFFVVLMSIFALLITSTMDRLKFEQQKDDFPWLVFSTLEKNKLVSTGIEFYENAVLTMKELTEMGITTMGTARKITVKTVPQEKEIIKVILSHDGKELIKIIKKEKQQ